MLYSKYNFITGTALTTFMCLAVSFPIKAEDCTGVLPGASCVLDEDTTAALGIDNGVTLFINGSVNLGHDIDGSNTIGDGTISSAGGGIGDTITQTSDIGSRVGVDQLNIAGDDTWVTSGAINTNNDGSDIDLGAADGGEELQFISGGSFLGEIDGNAADIVNFGADGNGGNFYARTQIEAVSVVITSGSLTTNSSIGSGVGLGALTVNNDANLIMNSNVSILGALDVDGSVYISSGNTLSTDTYVVDGDNANFTLAVGVDAGATSSGTLMVGSGGPVDLSSDTVKFAVDTSSEPLQSGIVNGVVNGNGGATIMPTVVDSSYMYDFSLLQNGDDLDLVIAVRNIQSLTTSPNNNVIAKIMFNDFASSEVTAVNKVQSLLGNDSTSSSFNERLESLLPTMDSGYSVASNIFAREVQLAAQNRTVSSPIFKSARDLRLSGDEIVFLSGNKNLELGQSDSSDARTDENQSNGLWGKVFYDNTSQSKDNVDGSSINATGIIAGADMVDPSGDMMMGAAIVIGRATVNSDNANSTKTDVDSLGFSLYGGRKVMKDTLFNAILTYIHNNNDTIRSNVGGVYGQNANAKFKSEQISIKSGVSRNFVLVNNMYIRPHAFVSYDYISADKYRERGADLALDVSYASINSLVAGFGTDIGRFYLLENGVLLYPSAQISYGYTIAGNGLESSTTIADKNFIVAGNNPAKHNLNTGVSVKLQKDDNLQIDAEYVLGLNEYQQNHALSVKATYGF